MATIENIGDFRRLGSRATPKVASTRLYDTTADSAVRGTFPSPNPSEPGRPAITTPHCSERQLAIARLESSVFEFEKVIAMLKKESDGGSRTIPKFEMLLGAIRYNVGLLRGE